MTSDRTGQHRLSITRSRLLLVAGVILAVANMRASITGMGSLIGEIRSDTGISGGAAGLLTTLPLLTFSLLSLFAPGLARRFGLERALLAALLVLTGGILLRSAPPVAALFAGTVILGAAIALLNVLLPALIKRDFPRNIGLMTGAYSTTMGLMAAIASGVSVPIARQGGFGWQGALGCWAVLAAISAIAWLPQSQRKRPDGASVEPPRGVLSLWRSPLAWQVTLFMGLQSIVFYVIVAWLTTILQSEGMRAATAGWMLSLFQLVGLPATFLVPALATRRPDQRGLVVVTVSLVGVGVLGLLLSGGSAPVVWVVLMGLGGGSFISLAYTFFTLRAPDIQTVAALSGMAQAFGYLLAAAGPVLFGYLYDLTHSWTIPLGLLFVVVVGLFAAGLGAGRDARVAPAAPPASR